MHTKIRTMCAFALMAVMHLSVAEAEDWTSFRGQSGKGYTSESNIPVRFNLSTGENVAWIAELPLAGASTPVVAEGRLFLHSAQGRERRVLCFDATSGDKLWEKTPSATDVPFYEDAYDNAGPSGVTDGSRYVAAFANGDAMAYSRDGRELWARSLADASMNTYGAASSLAIHGSTVFAQIDTGQDIHFCALNISDGSEIWRTAVSAYSWASPVITTMKDGTRALVAATSPDIITLDARKGKILWRADFLDGDVAPSPVVVNGRAIAMFSFSGAYAMDLSKRGELTMSDAAWNREYLEESSLPETVSPASDGRLVYIWNQSTLSVIEAETGKTVYEKILDVSGTYASATVAGDKVLLVGSERLLVVRAGRSFELLGESTVQESIDASPIVSNGRVYLRSPNHLYCLRQGAQGRPFMPAAKKAEAHGQANVQSVSTPSEAPLATNDEPTTPTGDWLQFRGPGRKNFTAETINADTWADSGPPLLWSADTGKGNGTVIVKDDRGYILGSLRLDREDAGKRRREVLSCLDLNSGRLIWQQDVHAEYPLMQDHGNPHTTPSWFDGRVYVHSVQGHVTCYNAADGHEVWHRNPVKDLNVGVKKYGVTSSPLVRDGKVFTIAVGRDPNSEKAQGVRGKGVGVYAFDADNGKDLWQSRFDIGGQTPHGSCVWATVDDKPTVLAHLSEIVVGLDPDTGDVLWKIDYMEAFPECKGGRVYSSESWPMVMEDGLIIDRIWNDIASKDCDPRVFGSLGRVVAFRVEDGVPAIVWSNDRVSPYYLGLQPWNGYLYGLNNKRLEAGGRQWVKDRIVCMEIATGKIMWQTRDWMIPGINDGVRRWQQTSDPAMTIAGGAAIIADKRELVVVECNPRKFRRIAAFRQGLSRWSMPVVAYGRLYVRSGEKLLCYKVK